MFECDFADKYAEMFPLMFMGARASMSCVHRYGEPGHQSECEEI